MTRWLTFDCYGTLIDWNHGISSTFEKLWPDADADLLLARYHEIEPRVQQGSSLPYRQVLGQGLRLLADEEGLALAAGDEAALADALPSWRPFPEAPGALADLRGRGFKLVILSNTDPDLLAASLEQIAVPVEGAVTAAEAGSYKPAHSHWDRFFERFGADPERHVHVGASVFHDLEPAAELGLRAVWINRLREASDVSRAAELKDLSRLPEVADSLVPAGPPP
jgi:2-haloacid dehalogenase